MQQNDAQQTAKTLSTKLTVYLVYDCMVSELEVSPQDLIQPFLSRWAASKNLELTTLRFRFRSHDIVPNDSLSTFKDLSICDRGAIIVDSSTTEEENEKKKEGKMRRQSAPKRSDDHQREERGTKPVKLGYSKYGREIFVSKRFHNLFDGNDFSVLDA